MKTFVTMTIVLSVSCGLAYAGSFATEVVDYTPGANANASYDDPTTALGEPTRITGSGEWLGDVSPFNPAYMTDQIVSIGASGSLDLKMGVRAHDNPLDNDWGIDLLIFTNSFYVMQGDGTVGGLFGITPKVQVSQNGADWFEADVVSTFPTMGFSDTVESGGGTDPTDFTWPVDPSFSPVGKTLAELQEGYDGSGGGVGVDIASTGLEWVEYIRIYQDAADESALAVDAVSVVPEPTTIAMLLMAGTGLSLRKRRS